MNPPTKPTKPTDTRLRVYRGGSWWNETTTYVRSGVSSVDTPTNRINDIGFRCALRGCERKVKP